MKELEKINLDSDIKIDKRVQEESKLKKVGHIKPHRGHTLYKFNKKTLLLSKAAFEEFDYTDKNKKRVIVEEECIYVSALNKKNAVKKIAKYHGIKVGF